MGRSNHENAFRIQQSLLMKVGIWPRKNPSLFNKLQTFTLFFLTCSFTFSLFLSVLFIKEFSPLIQNWTMFVSIFNCCLKFGLFYYKQPYLVKMLNFLHSPHFSYYDEDLDVHIQSAIRTATVTTKIFLTSAACTVASLVFAPTVSPKPRQLPFPSFIDFTEQPFLLYLCFYVFQSVALSACAWTSIGIDNVAPSMMTLSSAYLKILKTTIVRTTEAKSLSRQIDNLSDEDFDHFEEFDKRINGRLSVCIEHHLAVIRFTETTESIVTYIVLLQFLASIIAICLAGFTFTSAPVGSVEFMFALSLPITLIIQISLYCYFGNEVTLQSGKILDACYHTEWIACGPLVRKTLFIIMERSKRPLILTAGKFVNLNLTSLVGVFRSAISYGIVLRQMTEIEE